MPDIGRLVVFSFGSKFHSNIPTAPIGIGDVWEVWLQTRNYRIGEGGGGRRGGGMRPPCFWSPNEMNMVTCG